MRRPAAAFVPLAVIAMLMVAPRSRASAQTPTVAPAGTPSPSAAQVAKEIESIEQKEADALLRSDLAMLERLWAPQLMITASNNTIRTGAEVLGFLKSGQMKLTKLDRRVERVGVYGDVAVAMGQETFIPAAAGEGQGKTFDRRYTDVYLRQDGRWQLIARQASLIQAKP